jgi:hypothetical protein
MAEGREKQSMDEQVAKPEGEDSEKDGDEAGGGHCVMK